MLDALLFTKTPSLLSSVYRECLWKVDTKEKVLYLTFDDGLIAGVTPFVLEQLKKYTAKATFFCIGKNIEANPDIFQSIISEGHSIGNHTYDHLNGWNYDNKEYYANVEKCATVLTDVSRSLDYVQDDNGVAVNDAGTWIAGDKPLFRPPYGKLKPAQYKHLKEKYRLVMWDVLSFDFDANLSEEKILKNVTGNTEPGSIIVFHDSLKAKAHVEFALPKVLEHFSAKGFKFEKL